MPTETRLAARNSQGDEIFYHENPYPPANVVELFERYTPGAAKELLEMAKADQRNNFEIANRASKLNFCRSCFGFALTAIFIICGTILLYSGHWATGSVSVIVALLGLIGTITTGQASKR